MTLRKIAALGLAASTLALVGTSVAGAVGTGDVKGPNCADIVGGAGGYSSAGAGIQLQLAAPSCQGVTYALVAYDDAGNQTVVGSASVAGDGSEQITLQATIDDSDDNTICVYVASMAGRGPHVFDRGPDAGCISMTKDNAPGFQDFS